MEKINCKIIKKDGNLADFNPEKIKVAVSKSADRVSVKFTEEDIEKIISIVCENIRKENKTEVSVPEIHKYVELALDEVNPKVAKSYRDYRNYKQDFVAMMDGILKANKEILYIGDRENANSDSALTSTKRSLLYKKVSRELYQKIFLTPEEVKIIKDGYIYIHD